MITLKKSVNLDAPIKVEPLNGVVFTQENKGHEFIISCFHDKVHSDLSGTISVRFMRADRQTVYLAPNASSGHTSYTSINSYGDAEVTLHQDCYNVPGRFQMVVFNTDGGNTNVIYACIGHVQASQGEALIDSGEVVPSIDQLLAQIEACGAATERANTAADDAIAAIAGSVRYDREQTLTNSEKETARENIGAISDSEFTSFRAEVTENTTVPQPHTETGEIFVTAPSIDALEISGADSAIIRNTQIFEPRFGNGRFFGIQITRNNDGSYTVNGTATSSAYVYLNQDTRTGLDNVIALDGEYTMTTEVLSGSISLGESTNNQWCAIAAKNGSSSSTILGKVYYTSEGSMPSIYTDTRVVNANNVVFFFRTTTGMVYDNFTFRIMVNSGNQPKEWIPYQEPQTVTTFEGVADIARTYLPNLWIITTPNTAEITVTLRESLKGYIDSSVSGVADSIDEAVQEAMSETVDRIEAEIEDAVTGRDYMQDGLERIVAQLKGKSELGNIITFGFSTDQHIKDEDDETATLPVLRGMQVLSKLTRDYPFDFICLGGDACDAGNYAQSVQLILDECLTIQKPLYDAWCPVIPLTGNHDAHQNNEDVTNEMLFNVHFKRIANSGFLSGWDTGHTNGYWDSVAHHVRFVFFDDTIRANWGYTQVARNTALTAMLAGTPEGYKIVIFSHHALSQNLTDPLWANSCACQNILHDYKNKIICCVCGHSHADISEVSDDILFIATTCAQWLSRDRSNNVGTRNTETETAFDTFVIDQVNQAIYAFRYGRGAARVREWTYTLV